MNILISEKIRNGISMDDSNLSENETPVVETRVVIQNAVVQNISYNRNNANVLIAYNDTSSDCPCEEKMLSLIVNKRTKILDENGDYMSVSKLQKGMVVNATISPEMTKSIPPQSIAYRIQVQNRPMPQNVVVTRILSVDAKRQYILTMSNHNPSSIIQFMVSPNTIILDAAGNQIGLDQLSPGMRVSIAHAAFMTASIPPQTTAFVIQILK